MNSPNSDDPLDLEHCKTIVENNVSSQLVNDSCVQQIRTTMDLKQSKSIVEKNASSQLVNPEGTGDSPVKQNLNPRSLGKQVLTRESNVVGQLVFEQNQDTAEKIVLGQHFNSAPIDSPVQDIVNPRALGKQVQRESHVVGQLVLEQNQDTAETNVLGQHCNAEAPLELDIGQQQGPLKRRHEKWTDGEESALRLGVDRYKGKSKKFVLILEDEELKKAFKNRSNSDLNNKWRNMENKRLAALPREKKLVGGAELKNLLVDTIRLLRSEQIDASFNAIFDRLSEKYKVIYKDRRTVTQALRSLVISEVIRRDGSCFLVN